MSKKTLHKQFCKAGMLLAFAGVIVTYGTDILAEEMNQSPEVSQTKEEVNVGDENKKVELRDQTFTLGRLKIDKGTDYEYKASIPENGIVGGVLTDESEVTPLPEGFEGYVEVKGRIKSGDKVWLEISLGGEPAGYVTQGRLEVKPVTRTKNIGIPEGLGTDQVTVTDVPMYSNLTFLNTKEDVLPKDTAMTILGVYDVTFYNRPVKSVKVETKDGLTGWVKPTDIKEDTTQGKEEAKDSKEGKDTKEELVTASPGTVIYTLPTYLEDSEVESTLFKDTEVKVVETVEDTEVRGTYYKVFTKDGKEGYIEVNAKGNGVERKVVSTEKIALDVRLREPKVLLTKPQGVTGARDTSMLGVDVELQAIEKVTTEDADGNKGVFYRLTDSSGEFVGYASEKEVIDLNSDEAKEADKAKAEKKDDDKDTKSGGIDIDGLDLEGLNISGLGIDNKEGDVKVDELEGWTIAENPNPTKINTSQGYVAPNSATKPETVNFIRMLAPYTNQVKEGGLYPSIMIAQAILESDSGQSGLAVNSLNLFGIKGSYRGQSTTYNTQEASGTSFYGIRAGFRDYPTLQEGISDYVNLLRNSNYTSHGVVNAPSAFHSLTGLKEAGYATDPLYVPKVWRVIDSYDLTQFD